MAEKYFTCYASTLVDFRKWEGQIQQKKKFLPQLCKNNYNFVAFFPKEFTANINTVVLKKAIQHNRKLTNNI